jgi:hypothetical protein
MVGLNTHLLQELLHNSSPSDQTEIALPSHRHQESHRKKIRLHPTVRQAGRKIPPPKEQLR